MVTTPLRERLPQAIHIRNMSDRTEEIYIQCVARFAQHFRRSPDRLGRGEIEQYLLFLRDVKRVSWAWFNQTVCALRFFYLYVLDCPDLVQRIPYGRRERHLPVVLSVDELVALLGNIESLRDRVLLTVLYSAGLRLGEVCRLRVADIDRAHAHRRSAGKRQEGPLCSALARDPRSAPSMVARHASGRLPLSQSEGLLAPSVPLHRTARRQSAARRAGLTKCISPRTLRHSFATHPMEQGTSTRVIQSLPERSRRVLLGHSGVRTTETYTHVTPAHARSPLDGLKPPDHPPRT